MPGRICSSQGLADLIAFLGCGPPDEILDAGGLCLPIPAGWDAYRPNIQATGKLAEKTRRVIAPVDQFLEDINALRPLAVK